MSQPTLIKPVTHLKEPAAAAAGGGGFAPTTQSIRMMGTVPDRMISGRTHSLNVANAWSFALWMMLDPDTPQHS